MKAEQRERNNEASKRLEKCCENAKFVDGVREDSKVSKHSAAQEPIAGVLSRLAVMACLHFDFRLALRYCSDVEDIPMAANSRGGRNA